MEFILVIAIIVLMYINSTQGEEIKKLKKQVKYLTEKVNVLKEYVRRYGNENDVNNVVSHKENTYQTTQTVHRVEGNVEKVSETLVQNNVVNTSVVNNEIKQEKVVKPKISAEDSRNTMILSAGAIFIILAAIVFLVSTWNVIPNILKTIILVVFVEVFLVLSKVAKEKFNLVHASTTFFYIAMAYIPICLYSIPFFGLFGEFLSITGEGKYIYFTLVNILIAVIYAYQYNKNSSNVLLYGSILMQYLSVIFFSLIFGTDLSRVVINLGLYNIVVYIFTDKFEIKEVLGLCYKVIAGLITVLALCVEPDTFLSAITYGVVAINFLLLERRHSNKAFALIFNIALSMMGVALISLLNIKSHMQELLSMIYFVAVFIIQNSMIINKSKENLKFSSIVITVCAIGLLQINAYAVDSIVPGYVYSLVNMFILFVSYGVNDTFIKESAAILIPIEFISTYLNFGIVYNENNLHYFMILSILTFVIGELLRNPKLELLHKRFFVISHINLFLTYSFMLIDDIDFVKNFIYVILVTEIYGYSYFKDRKNNVFFKYLDYIFTNFSLFSICAYFDLNELCIGLIPMATAVLISFIEEKLELLNDKVKNDNFFDIYLAISSMCSYLFIIELNEPALYFCGIVYTIALFYRYYIKNKNVNYNIVPIIGFFLITMELDCSDAVYVLLYLVAGTAFGALSIIHKNFNVFTIPGYLCIIALNDIIEIDFICTLIGMAYTFVHVIFMEEGIFKDLYRAVTIGFGLSIYYQALDMLGLYDVYAFKLLGTIGTLSIILRLIVKKYVKDISVYEYGILGVAYLSFLGAAETVGDGIGMLLVVLVLMLYSYYKKYGSQFIVNVAALILGSLYLTREFWTNLPWWLYLLGIGSILIVVAVRNEAREKENKISIGKFIDDVIEKIEK